MASFMMAMTINPDARKNHPDISHMVEQSFDLFADANLKVIRLFATLGRYDYLILFEAADQKEAFKVAAAINNAGTLRSETWPLIEYEDFSRLIG
jgi:uncharacterized protein with GYD domain